MNSLSAGTISLNNLWIDESNAEQWAEACHREIVVWLSVIAGQEVGEKLATIANNLKIEIRPPAREAAELAYEQNFTLTGEIGFRWFDEEQTLTIPMPYHGVFLNQRDGSRHPLAATWPSWLAERLAFRGVRPTREKPEKKGSQEEWRVGLPDGTWVGAALNKDSKPYASRSRSGIKKPLYLGLLQDVPDWLEGSLGLYGPRGGGKKQAASQAHAWGRIHRQILERSDQLIISDEDDLHQKILMTFPVWLKQKVSSGLLAAVLSGIEGEEKGSRKRAEAVLGGWNFGDEEMGLQASKALWASLPALGMKINWAINNFRSLDRADFIDPVNPLELVSRITRVRRIHRPSSKLEKMPPEYRQNHPSFQGRICPVESPESAQVGLTLHLASGAEIDFDGKIYPATTASGELGFGARLVPFFAHNDGARNMMGAKNLRQSIPVLKSEPPKVRTGGERLVAAMAEPLVSLGVCPMAGESTDDFHTGRDLLVAYMPWQGMNFEDAVVLGQQVVDDGLLDCSGFRKVVRRQIKMGWVPADPDNTDRAPGLKDGLIQARTRVTNGTPLACFKWEGKKGSKERIIRYEDRLPVNVRRIEFHRRNEWTGGILEYEIELPIPIRHGDKLMGRHGNKGVVGSILPEKKMPRLPNDPKLPKHLQGRVVDVLLNPHGVISRMNLGQLMETHIGWLLHSGIEESALMKEGSSGECMAEAFSEAIDHDRVQNHLESTGLDRYGRIQLNLPDGTRTTAPVVVGFQHIVRLRHIPELKSQARRGGAEALYSARTGQAVHGKKIGGGQRLGEMEIWALAAHRADAVIAEVLGIKSSAEMIAANGMGKPLGGSEYTGYSRVFKDWLFAMGVEVSENKEKEKVRLCFLEDGALPEKLGEASEVKSSGGLEACVAAPFRCVQAGKNECDYELLDGEPIEFHVNASKDEPTLKLADLLKHFSLRPSGKLVADGEVFKLPLTNQLTDKESATLVVSINCSTDQVKAEARFEVPGAGKPASKDAISDLAEKMGQAEWERKDRSFPELCLYGRFKRTGGEDNWTAEELLEQFLNADPENWTKPPKQRTRCLTDMTIVCPHHRQNGVRGVAPFTEIFRSKPGGLFDPRIFGAWSSGFRSSNQWGFIKLPVPVKYPLHVFLTNSTEPEDQKKAVENFVSGLGIEAPVEIPELSFIPVLPVRYRLPMRSGDRLVRDEIERKGYLPLLKACQTYSQAKETQRDKCAKWIANCVERIFRLLAVNIGKKDGLIRRDGLGRRVDRSARLVITPDPSLKWDQVGVPTSVLLELMGDILIDWLSGLTAEKKSKLPQFKDCSWMQSNASEEVIENDRKVLVAFFEANPDFVVLLNRQPSLHRDSVQAFRPRPLGLNIGEVIRLCPLACKGFGADFDGDEMVIHLPVGEAAQADARRLLPSNNLHSMATKADGGKNLLAHFDQDFVLGTWFLGQDDEAGYRNEFLKLLPEGDCREIAKKWIHPGQGEGLSLMAKLVARDREEDREEAPTVIAEWMKLAFDACSCLGISFGYYDLKELNDAIQADVEAVCRRSIEEFLGADGIEEQESNAVRYESAKQRLEAILDEDEGVVDCALPDYNAMLSELAEKKLKVILDEGDIQRPGFMVGAMSLSGARGKKQIRQLIAARGMLDPGKLCFDAIKHGGMSRFFYPHSLTEGLSQDEAFWAAMNARSSMVDKKLGTGLAGGLTRSLVFALWSYEISGEDCGSDRKKRNPVSCLYQNGCCAKCYERLPSGEYPPVGFPVGLIAAQSIGERGTQLSMQSFHAGSSAIDIQSVRAAMNHSKFFGSPDGMKAFMSFIGRAGAYSELQERHFQLLWRVFHDRMELGGRPLHSAISNQDEFTLLGYRHNTAILAQALLKHEESDRRGPVAKLFLGGYRPVIQNEGA